MSDASPPIQILAERCWWRGSRCSTVRKALLLEFSSVSLWNKNNATKCPIDCFFIFVLRGRKYGQKYNVMINYFSIMTHKVNSCLILSLVDFSQTWNSLWISLWFSWLKHIIVLEMGLSCLQLLISLVASYNLRCTWSNLSQRHSQILGYITLLVCSDSTDLLSVSFCKAWTQK